MMKKTILALAFAALTALSAGAAALSMVPTQASACTDCDDEDRGSH